MLFYLINYEVSWLSKQIFERKIYTLTIKQYHMGVYDFVLIEPEVELPDYKLEKSQWEISWQTRAFRDPMYRLHVITEDGYIYRADQKHDETGFAESHGETGSHSFLEKIQNGEYDGYPIQYSDFDWYRIRYVGDMRVTAQSNESGLHMYDINFNRHSIDSIDYVEDSYSSKQGDISAGDTVYDKETNVYEVVEITEEIAQDYIASEKVMDRGHTIYQEQTVADRNPDYPEDDIVVIISPKNEDRKIPVPISRITDNVFESVDF